MKVPQQSSNKKFAPLYLKIMAEISNLVKPMFKNQNFGDVGERLTNSLLIT